MTTPNATSSTPPTPAAPSTPSEPVSVMTTNVEKPEKSAQSPPSKVSVFNAFKEEKKNSANHMKSASIMNVFVKTQNVKMDKSAIKNIHQKENVLNVGIKHIVQRDRSVDTINVKKTYSLTSNVS